MYTGNVLILRRMQVYMYAYVYIYTYIHVFMCVRMYTGRALFLQTTLIKSSTCMYVCKYIRHIQPILFEVPFFQTLSKAGSLKLVGLFSLKCGKRDV